MVMTLDSAAQHYSPGKLPRPGSLTSLVRKMFESVYNPNKNHEGFVGSDRRLSVGHDAHSMGSEAGNCDHATDLRNRCPYSAVREHPVPYVFQMPVNYPSFTKRDYETMPEWMLDRLLEEYGVPTQGDIKDKRDYCIGAFLWPDQE